MLSIHTYFRTLLKADPLDDTLYDLPVDSGCGDYCKAAIDAAAAYLRVADPSPSVREPMLQSLRRTISIFWHG